MSARASSFQKVLGAFLASVIVVLLIAFAQLVLPQESLGTLASAVVAVCIFLGLAWMIIGWMFVPSVETYLGQGAMKGVPIIGPSFANPERSLPVLRDLAWKLSGQTDAGIVVAALGFVLMTIGIVFSLSSMAGLAALVGFGVCLSAALVLTVRSARPAAAP